MKYNVGDLVITLECSLEIFSKCLEPQSAIDTWNKHVGKIVQVVESYLNTIRVNLGSDCLSPEYVKLAYGH